jgi:hypothetical protein
MQSSEAILQMDGEHAANQCRPFSIVNANCKPIVAVGLKSTCRMGVTGKVGSGTQVTG